ncbi:MAG: hypothetical protein QM501_00905, partial [Gimesia sp.]
QAHNGETSFSAGGYYRFTPPSLDQDDQNDQSYFSFQVGKLPLDNRFRSRLSGGLARTFDTLRPSGNIDLNVTLTHPGTGKWQIQDLVVSMNDGEAMPIHFPYRVDHIKGELKQQDNDTLKLNFFGMAGNRPVTAKGFVKHPGPASEIDITVEIEQVPIDTALLSASPEAIKTILNQLDLQGKADVAIKLTRAPMLDQPIHLDLLAKMDQGALQYKDFPYRISDLSGRVFYSSKTGRASFDQVKGTHGNSRLSATGSFARFENDGKLNLSIIAQNTACDSSLRLALPKSLQELWEQLSPRGIIDLETEIEWERGKPVVISIPNARWRSGSMMIKDFPYPVDNLKANWSYIVNPQTQNSEVRLTSISGKHDETLIRIGEAFAEVTSQGDWRVQLNKMDVDDLSTDRAFQQALPDDMASALSTLNIQRPISASGMIEIRGSQRVGTSVTAAWDMNVFLAENTLTTGVDVTKVYGKVHSKGTWDGARLDLTGEIDLDSAVVLDYHLTEIKGPFEIHDQRLTVGSQQIRRDQVRAVGLAQIRAKQPITAKAIRGVLTCLGEIELTTIPTYNIQIELNRGLLEEYAARYMPGESQLLGVMNGWIQLWGRGSNKSDLKGQGQLQISPASIYELPPIAQIFKVFRLAQPDKTAFDSAFCEFTVSNETFHLKYIELKGNAISLYGQAGEAHFDGRLKVDLFSKLTRRHLPLPAITQLIGHATSGWIRVELRGTTSTPIVNVKSNPLLDGSLKSFLNNGMRSRPAINLGGRRSRAVRSDFRPLKQFSLPFAQ